MTHNMCTRHVSLSSSSHGKRHSRSFSWNVNPWSHPVARTDQKAALQEILLHHQNNQYAPNLLPPSPRALPSTATDPLLLTPVLTPHLASATPNLPTQQQQIGPPLVPLSHEHSPAGINTLYSSLQSAPKKRKLSQDGLIHVKQVFSRFARVITMDRRGRSADFDFHWQFCYLLRNPSWAPSSTVAAAAARCWTTMRSPTAVTSTPVTSAFGSILSSKPLGIPSAITISRNCRCLITEWTPTRDLILAIRTMRLFARRRTTFR